MHDLLTSILKNHGLYITESRLRVLEVFLRTNTVMDQKEVLHACESKLDRITVYRTLYQFYKNNILFKIPSSDGIIRYGMQLQQTQTAHGHKMHLICQECGHVLLLDNILLPESLIPPHFYTSQVDLIVNGKCNDCQLQLKQKY